jgi:hypothetical protein
MKQLFSFINDKPACTYCILYFMKNSFSENVGKKVRMNHINMVSHLHTLWNYKTYNYIVRVHRWFTAGTISHKTNSRNAPIIYDRVSAEIVNTTPNL